MNEIKNYLPYGILEALRNRDISDDQLNAMTAEEIFNEWFSWHFGNGHRDVYKNIVAIQSAAKKHRRREKQDEQ